MPLRAAAAAAARRTAELIELRFRLPEIARSSVPVTAGRVGLAVGVPTAGGSTGGARSGVALRVLVLDLLARGRKHIPLAAGQVQALAVGLTGLRVLHEAVERMAGVRDLRRPVGTPGDAEQRLLDRALRDRLAVGQQLGRVCRAGG